MKSIIETIYTRYSKERGFFSTEAEGKVIEALMQAYGDDGLLGIVLDECAQESFTAGFRWAVCLMRECDTIKGVDI